MKEQQLELFAFGGREPCIFCKGTGEKGGNPPWEMRECPYCRGTGKDILNFRRERGRPNAEL